MNAGTTHDRLIDQIRPRPNVAAMGVISLLVAASVAVAGPELQSVVDEIGAMSPGWIVAAVLLELASCLSFVVIFRHFFHDVPARHARRLAWTGLASNALLPGGGVSCLAVPGWLMHREGMPARTVVRHSGGLFFLTTATNAGLLATAAVLLATGLASGPHDFMHAGLPLLVCAGLIAAVSIFGRGVGSSEGAAWRRGLADGARDAAEALSRPGWCAAGAAGYLLFDVAALGAAFAACGHPLPAAALALAYVVGYIANAVPVPGGIGALDAGLAGALVAYGAPVGQAGAAVLVYHAIVFWLPSVVGSLAFVSLRRAA